ncbi:MAG: GNAT family N-acetyltransferase [Candidatus Heimdallarchaeota archaeon]|nr:GNAT family N-acetyltransferase [Candidatus Heimdallarchaeota archaeon]MBY8994904.1 GNAT family N-acetyltransferase [Candidatus Heimdallarchaeota archaeon]
MKIRLAIKEDIPSIIDIWEKSGLLIRPKGRDAPENLANQLNESNLWILVAEESGEINGVVLVTHDTRKGWINRLATKPTRTREGIATKLLHAAEKSLFEIGIEVIALLIKDDNLPSRVFFEKENYKYSEEIAYYSKRLDLES